MTRDKAGRELAGLTLDAQPSAVGEETIQAAAEPAAADGPIRMCYYLQTHNRSAQVTRLVEVLKEGSPNAIVLVSHDIDGPPLDVARLEALPGVHVFLEKGGYGDFTHIARYFAAIDWLDENGIEYDWLENFSGQDYPIRPLAEIERNIAKLGADGYDGFMLYTPVFQHKAPRDIDWGAGPEFKLDTKLGASWRYLYRNWRFGKVTPRKQLWLKPLMGIDLLQPWVMIDLAFCAVGVRRRRLPLPDGWTLYGGWFFTTLSKRAVRYVREYARNNPEMMEYYRTVSAPEEIFLQTTLINSGKFRFVPDSRHYIDFSVTKNGHPRTLDLSDVDKLKASDAHWARKFDIDRGTELFDVIDEWVRPLDRQASRLPEAGGFATGFAQRFADRWLGIV